jgi:hypothetical protein
VGRQRRNQGGTSGIHFSLVDGMGFCPLQQVGWRKPPVTDCWAQFHLKLRSLVLHRGPVGDGGDIAVRPDNGVIHHVGHRFGFGLGLFFDLVLVDVFDLVFDLGHRGHRASERVRGFVIVAELGLTGLGLAAAGRSHRPPHGAADSADSRLDRHTGEQHHGHHQHRYQHRGGTESTETGTEGVPDDGSHPAASR